MKFIKKIAFMLANEITFKGVDFSTSAPVAVILPDDVTLVLESGTVNRLESTYTSDEAESYSCGLQGKALLKLDRAE